MEIQLLIKKFEEVNSLIAQFEEKNHSILSEFNSLKEMAEKLQEGIKESVRESNEDVVTNVFTCQIIKPYKKWIDYDLALQNLSVPEIFILDKITETKKEVDFKKFEAFVKNNILPQKAWVEAFKEEAQTPRIVFKLNK